MSFKIYLVPKMLVMHKVIFLFIVWVIVGLAVRPTSANQFAPAGNHDK